MSTDRHISQRSLLLFVSALERLLNYAILQLVSVRCEQLRSQEGVGIEDVVLLGLQNRKERKKSQYCIVHNRGVNLHVRLAPWS